MTNFRLVIAGAVAAAGFSLLGAGTACAIQLHMVDAKDALQRGLNDLKMALPDQGGHRDQAINLVEQALVQIDESIQGIEGTESPTGTTESGATEPSTAAIPGLPAIPGL